MGLAPFQFKHFSINHDRTAMRVGTDGVLLGAWVDVTQAKNILDVGTGTGVIALMLAQRSDNETVIHGIELELDAYQQAVENVRQSPWPTKVEIHHGAIQNFYPASTFDLIVSNPPYFENSQKPPDEKRLQTRHTVTLSFLELLVAAKRLLTRHGKFNVILPYKEGLAFVDLALNHQFYCSRQWSFRTRRAKPIERWLLEFRLEVYVKEEGEIILYDTGETWSDAYKSLTKDFYLKA